MPVERIEKLKQEYTDKCVVVDGRRPELARFKGMVGRVKTINFNGFALVEFDGNENRGWHDVELDHLKVVDNPERKQAATQGEAAANPHTPNGNGPPRKQREAKLSDLERARMAKQAEPKP
jgi:hypothetical protein